MDWLIIIMMKIDAKVKMSESLLHLSIMSARWKCKSRVKICYIRICDIILGIVANHRSE